MERVTFIGCSKNKSAKDTTYYMLHFCVDLEENKSVISCSGCYPVSCRIDDEEYQDFKDLEFGTEFDCSYEVTYDKYNNRKNILKRYSI